MLDQGLEGEVGIDVLNPADRELCLRYRTVQSLEEPIPVMLYDPEAHFQCAGTVEVTMTQFASMPNISTVVHVP